MKAGKEMASAMMLRGVVTILFGVFAMVWPIATVVALVVTWGVFAVLDGILGGIVGFSRNTTSGQKWLSILLGVLSLAAGIFLVLRPLQAAVALTWVLGIWLVARGVVDAASAFTYRSSARWWLVVAGVLSVIAGALIVANPGTAALAFAVWVGLFALMWGIFLFISGFMLRRGAKAAERTSVPTG